MRKGPYWIFRPWGINIYMRSIDLSRLSGKNINTWRRYRSYPSPYLGLSRFEFALFSHFINEKIDSLFRNLEFGRNPRRR